MLKHVVLSVNDAPVAKPDGLTIFCMADGPGATWRLSFELPLRRQREAGNIRLVCLEERVFDRFDSRQVRADISWLLSDISPNVVVLSRCNSLAAIILIEIAAERRLPIVYHLDDDLFAVPKELGKSKFDYYSSPARQAALRTCCERANLVYCSTGTLALRLGRFGFSTPTTFGEIYCSAPEPFAEFAPKQPRTIGYMGTGGHKADLESVLPAITAVMMNYQDVCFEILGTLEVPEQLRKAFPDRVYQLPPVADYDAFLDRMRRLGWAVALAPLKNNAFNAVKANTKFIEYTIAGLPAVVSGGQVYANVISGHAGLAAASIIEWITAIDRLLSDPAEARAQVERAQSRLRRDYSVEKLERQVMAVLKRAIDEREGSAATRKPIRSTGRRISEGLPAS